MKLMTLGMLILTESGIECESIKHSSGGTVGHSRWQSPYTVLWVSLARYIDEYF